MAFRPYKYLKEFYNSDRLVMPSCRDQLINTIFLGKSHDATETLLDNTDWAFFDLWTMVIKHYRYSFFESIRGELLVLPDVMSCLPPLCNVVFPTEYVHFGRKIQLRNVVTRFFDQGFQTTAPALGNPADIESISAANEAFVAPTSDIQPMMGDIIKAECTGVVVEPIDKSTDTAGKLSDNPEDNLDEGFIAFRQIPLPEEFHYGATYVTGDGEYLLRAGEQIARQNSGASLNQGSGLESEETFDLAEEYNNFHKLNVLYKYFLSRLQSQKTEQVKLTFTPRLIAGMSCLLLSKTGRHVFGLITSMSHSIDAEAGAETMLTIEYQYLYDDSSKRPLYIYRDRNAESKELDNSDGQVWKNYFLLSNDFRDRYIGEKMYKDILCDGIESSERNPFAKDFVKKIGKDYSILGIHSVFKNIVSQKSNITKTDTTNKKLGDFITPESPTGKKGVTIFSSESDKKLFFDGIENELSKGRTTFENSQGQGQGSGGESPSRGKSALKVLALSIQKIEGYYDGSVSFRNNNPGNLEYRQRTIEYGATGTDGRFAIFPDYTTGFNALKQLIIDVYINNTLTEMINKYAPPTENDTKSYIKNLAKILKVKPTDKIKDIIK